MIMTLIQLQQASHIFSNVLGLDKIRGGALSHCRSFFLQLEILATVPQRTVQKPHKNCGKPFLLIQWTGGIIGRPRYFMQSL